MLTLAEVREAFGDDDAFGRWLQGRGIWLCNSRHPSELQGYIVTPMQIVWTSHDNTYRVVGYLAHPHDDEWYPVKIRMDLCVKCDLMDILGGMA